MPDIPRMSVPTSTMHSSFAVDEVVGRDREVPRDHEIVGREAAGLERVERLAQAIAVGLEQRVVGVLAIAQRGEAWRDREIVARLRLDPLRDRDRVAMAADE